MKVTCLEIKGNKYLYLKSLKPKMINTSYLSIPYFNQVIKQGPELQAMSSTTSEASYCDSGGHIAMLAHAVIGLNTKAQKSSSLRVHGSI